jgi:hypothetical protein
MPRTPRSLFQDRFVDPSDGVGGMVTCGSYRVEVFKILTSPKPVLKQLSFSPAIGGRRNQGFLTSISSNPTANPLIWATAHRTDTLGSPIYLHEFDPESLVSGSVRQILMMKAGARYSKVVSNGGDLPSQGETCHGWPHPFGQKG